MASDHILPVPKPILALRVVQLVVAVVILGLSAYGVTWVAFDGDSLTLFTSLATMIIAVYVLVSTIAVQAAYNYWAVLGLDIFAIVFWIISFSLLGSEISGYYWSYSYSSSASTNYCTYYYGVCIKKRSFDLVPRYTTTNVYTYRNAMAAAAGLGGLEFILFVITLIFTAIYLSRHRAAGGHCTPGRTGVAAESNMSQQQQVYPTQTMSPQPQQQTYHAQGTGAQAYPQEPVFVPHP